MKTNLSHNLIETLIVNMTDVRGKIAHMPIRLLSTFVLLFVISSFHSVTLGADKVIYQDNTRKLYFTLDNTTKEASVGTGYTSDNQNALIFPAIGSPEWDTNYWTVWNNIDIPSTIVYNNETYTVTSISANSFYRCTYVSKISLPNTIKTIDYQAFGYCVNLEDFDFPSNLETIASSAFMLCRTLTKIILPSKVKTIGGGAFRDCTEAKELFIPASCSSIGNEAFNWCTSLEKIIIEDGPTSLTMGYCNARGISYKGTQGSCMRGMFGDAESIKEVHWGRNMILSSKSNGYVYAPFAYTTNFYSNTSGVQSSSTRSIKKLTFGEFVTEIPRNAFYDGSIKEKVVLPPNLKKINDEAFYKTFMDGTEVINFPASLEHVGSLAFEGPNGLEFKVIESDATNPPATLWDAEKKTGYPFLQRSNVLIISVPEGAGEAYQNDSFWGKFTIKDPNDEIITVNVKSPGTFYGRLTSQGAQIETTRRLKLLGQLNEDDWAIIKTMNKTYELDLEETDIETISANMIPSAVCSIKLPHNIKSLESNALHNRPLTGTLEIPASCTFIGSSAAFGILIDKLVLPDNGIEIGERAFFSLNNIEEVRLGKVNITGDNAFWSCDNIKKVIIEDGCNITGNGTFAGCYALETIVMNGQIENLGEQTFSISTKEESKINCIILNGTVRQSGENVFFNQNSNSRNAHYPIWRLEIKDMDGYLKSSFTGVTSSPMNYAREVDYNGELITSISIPEGISNVFDAMFRNCTSLESVVLPSTLEYIGEAAFEGCPIKSISLPESLKTINFDAFKNCKNLKEVVIPNSVETINPGAFNNCTSLQSVYAFYSNPMTLTRSNSWSSDYPFYNVNPECCLYIPIGTASRYRTAYWTFPKYQEIGTITITAQGKGQVIYNETAISEGSMSFNFKPYTPLKLTVVPNDSYVLKSVICNGENITESVIDNKLLFDDPDSDLNLIVTFGDSHIIGDSNSDNIITIADAVNIANHIIGLTTTNFNFLASDINIDGNITVSDVTSTVALVQSQTYDSSESKHMILHSAYDSDILSCINSGNNIYSFTVDGESDLSALQLDIHLNENDVTPVISLSESIAESHDLKISHIDGSTIRVVVFSPTSVRLPLNTTIFTLNTISEINEPICTNAFASDAKGLSKRLRVNKNTTTVNHTINDNYYVKGLCGHLLVSNAIGQEIFVYTPDGTCINRHRATSNNTAINIGRGLFIVRIGSSSYKVNIK